MDPMDIVQSGQSGSIYRLLEDIAAETAENRAVLQSMEHRLGHLEQELQWMQAVQRYTLEVMAQQTGASMDLDNYRQVYEAKLEAEREAQLEAQRAREIERNRPLAEKLKGFKMQPLPDSE
jgi:hypothetical protein